MPDISMCAHPTCPSRTLCRRHEASGTKASEWRQSWVAFAPLDGAYRCHSFLPLPPQEAAHDRD